MSSKVTSFILMASMYLAIMTTEVVGCTHGYCDPTNGYSGWTFVSTNDPEVLKAAASATQQLNEARNSAMIYQLLNVTFAVLEPVVGVIYGLGLNLGETNCFRQPTVKVKNCTAIKIVKVEQCTVTVWVWETETKVTHFICDGEKGVVAAGNVHVGGKTGGEVTVDINRKDVIEAATFATEEMTRRSHGRHRVQLKRIIKATSQVVAGAMYRMTLEVNLTSAAVIKGQIVNCTVEVLNRAWLPLLYRYNLERYHCMYQLP